MPSRVCTHSGEWTPSVWARVTEVLFRVRVRVERISCGTYRVERRVQVVWNVVSHFSFFLITCSLLSHVSMLPSPRRAHAPSRDPRHQLHAPLASTPSAK